MYTLIIHKLLMDTNINHYTIPELAMILNINDLLNKKDILMKTNAYIDKYKKDKNQKMYLFFQEAQDMLIDYSDTSNKTENQVDEWFNNEVLPQSEDPVQRDKITNRVQKIKVFEDQHVPMNRKQLGINNNYNVEVAQDTLNPNLKNTYNQLVNLDSQFRQASGVGDKLSLIDNSSTDYTLDLSDPLDNTLSLKLYSFQIPFTWYIIDIYYGNTCFWINDGNNTIPITLEPGNYNQNSLVIAITKSLINIGFTFTLLPIPQIPVIYNSNNGKITLNLLGGIYTNPLNLSNTFIITNTTKIIFYDPTLQLQCIDNNCIPRSLYINQTLGWVMGYRDAFELVETNGNTGQAVVDLNGPRYLILVIDDYNQNHINNGLVSITEYSNHLKLPNYYSPDLPFVCTPGVGLGTPQIEQLVPSAPRTLTNSQIYTINEIIKNNSNNANVKAKAPTSTDVLALIPIKQGTPFGSLYVDFSGSLQDNKRVYFGPVNIDRMRVRLLDDKGNVINLNGSDWSVTLIAEILYQY